MSEKKKLASVKSTARVVQPPPGSCAYRALLRRPYQSLRQLLRDTIPLSTVVESFGSCGSVLGQRGRSSTSHEASMRALQRSVSIETRRKTST